MQMILQQTDMGNTCRKAVAPVIAGGSVLFDAAVAAEAGALPLPVTTIASGAAAPYGGTINVKGCKNVLVEVDYLDGDDCDPCTDPDALVTATMSFVMQANSTYEVPAGFWTEIRATLIDTAGVAVDLVGTQTEMVTLHSGFNPGCTDCTVLAP